MAAEAWDDDDNDNNRLYLQDDYLGHPNINNDNSSSNNNSNSDYDYPFQLDNPQQGGPLGMNDSVLLDEDFQDEPIESNKKKKKKDKSPSTPLLKKFSSLFGKKPRKEGEELQEEEKEKKPLEEEHQVLSEEEPKNPLPPPPATTKKKGKNRNGDHQPSQHEQKQWLMLLPAVFSIIAWTLGLSSTCVCSFLHRTIETTPTTMTNHNDLVLERLVLQSHGVGFWGWQDPMDRVCFGYDVEGFPKPDFDAKFVVANVFVVVGNTLGGLVCVCLFLTTMSPVMTTLSRGLQWAMVTLLLAVLHGVMIATLSESSLCVQRTFFDYVLPPTNVTQPPRPTPVPQPSPEKMSDAIASVSCGFGTGGILALTAAVLWLCTSGVCIVTAMMLTPHQTTDTTAREQQDQDDGSMDALHDDEQAQLLPPHLRMNNRRPAASVKSVLPSVEEEPENHSEEESIPLPSPINQQQQLPQQLPLQREGTTLVVETKDQSFVSLLDDENSQSEIFREQRKQQQAPLSPKQQQAPLSPKLQQSPLSPKLHQQQWQSPQALGPIPQPPAPQNYDSDSSG